MILLLGGFVHDVGIALRRAQVVMAQQALDGRHRHVEIDQPRGKEPALSEDKGCSQAVAGHRLHPGFVRPQVDLVLHPAVGHRLPGRVAHQGRVRLSSVASSDPVSAGKTRFVIA